MKVNNLKQVPAKPVEMEGAHGCTVRWLLSQSDGTPTFALSGDGVVMEGDEKHKLTAGDVVLVQPNEVHQFRNTGAQPMRFLCLIPNSAASKTVTVAPECGVEQ